MKRLLTTDEYHDGLTQKDIDAWEAMKKGIIVFVVGGLIFLAILIYLA